MKLSLVFACFFIIIGASIGSWSKEDQEIFRLRHEVEVSEGIGVTFYDFLGIKASANQEEINQAYRKKSRILHPDKIKQQLKDQRSDKKPTQAEIKAIAKAASDRFARLGIVANILRGPSRERYNHFLNHGFPKWKGTGYYYARYRPGLGSVLLGLFIFAGGIGHWIVLYLGWKRQQDFINRYIKFARNAALGVNTVPGLENLSSTSTSTAPELQAINRRQRRMQDKDGKKEKKIKVKKTVKTSAASPEAAKPRKRVVAENGKILVVDSDKNVYLEYCDEDGETQEFLLDPDEIKKPHFSDTALIKLPTWLYRRTISRVISEAPIIINTEVETEDELDTANTSSGDNFELLESVKKTAENGYGKSGQRKKK